RNANAPLAARALLCASLCAISLLPSCTYQSFKRETDTTGTSRTEAISFDFLLFFRIPWNPTLHAMDLARDTWGDNLRVTRYVSYPDWGFFSFLNGFLIGWTGSVVKGEYGIPPDTKEGRDTQLKARQARGTPVNPDGSPITPLAGAD